MADKRTAVEGHDRPGKLSQSDVEALSAGKGHEGLEDRPRLTKLTEREMKAAGPDKETVKREGGYQMPSKPHDFTKKDVEALRSGKGPDLATHPRLKGE